MNPLARRVNEPAHISPRAAICRLLGAGTPSLDEIKVLLILVDRLVEMAIVVKECLA